jgi:predicted RNA-binding Zn-ribbon protein involved in translation (DUF1610 family)
MLTESSHLRVPFSESCFKEETRMNRIHLRLFTPSDDNAVDDASNSIHDDLSEDIIPIERARRSVIFSGRFMPAVDRARLIHQNGVCPECGHSDIEPLELSDSVMSPKNRLPIPGTATIVGFHCNDCGTEWPVYELSCRKI